MLDHDFVMCAAKPVLQILNKKHGLQLNIFDIYNIESAVCTHIFD